jgi:nitroimidazol reductase NimA-like FMN-containing flavoprotein (pyridoxamine 5'-phosphate oxidase superfamily)
VTGLRERVAAARIGRLATLRADGSPRLVPVTFVLVDGLICFAVDGVKRAFDCVIAERRTFPAPRGR